MGSLPRAGRFCSAGHLCIHLGAFGIALLGIHRGEVAIGNGQGLLLELLGVDRRDHHVNASAGEVDRLGAAVHLPVRDRHAHIRLA